VKKALLVAGAVFLGGSEILVWGILLGLGLWTARRVTNRLDRWLDGEDPDEFKQFLSRLKEKNPEAYNKYMAEVESVGADIVIEKSPRGPSLG